MSTVYVDPLFKAMSPERQARRLGSRNCHRWCHMWSDDVASLHAMALKIGLKREWFQDRRDFPHYDLTPGRRLLALARGAVEMSLRDWIQKRRQFTAEVVP